MNGYWALVVINLTFTREEKEKKSLTKTRGRKCECMPGKKVFCKPVSTPLGRPKSYYTPHIKPNIIRLRGEKGIIVFFPAVKALFCRSFSFVRASPLFFYERWSKQDPKPPFIPFGKTPPPTQVRDTLSSAESLVRRMTIFFVHLVERGKEGGPGKKGVTELD